MLMIIILLGLLTFGFGVKMISTLPNCFGKLAGYFIAIFAFLIIACATYTGICMKMGDCSMMKKMMPMHHMMMDKPANKMMTPLTDE